MANGALVVAAAAGGAVIAMAAMAGICAYWLQKQGRRPSRIDSAVNDTVSGVKAVRRLQADRRSLPHQPGPPVVELRTKRHLRLMQDRLMQDRPPRCAPAARTDRSSPRRGR